MSYPVLIVINGLPGTGKTTLSKKISQNLALPLLSKDSIKEILFDHIGLGDREWSKKIGLSSYKVLDYVIENQLKGGHSLVVESPLDPKYHNQTFQKWQAAYKFYCIQVLCYTDGQVLVDRYLERQKSAERHPGHVMEGNSEAERRAELAYLLKGKAEPLDLDGDVIEVNTTDFAKVDEARIIRQIKSVVHDPYLL